MKKSLLHIVIISFVFLLTSTSTIQASDVDEATEACKQAIRISPAYADAHTNLGFAYSSLGKYNEAMEAYRQAVRINPDDTEAHYFLGSSYVSLKIKILP